MSNSRKPHRTQPKRTQPKRTLNPIELGVFSSRIESICDEMGAMLQRAAFSPNIKDRLDFSCAVFGPSGELVAQAAHIPVHLGSMAFAMRSIVGAVSWSDGDMVVVNDPFKGGTHLPDVTVIAPVFVKGTCIGFVANRAHHANIGASSPGSMPISTSLEDEGIIIPPTHIMRNFKLQAPVFGRLLGLDILHEQDLPSNQASGDFAAQMSANRAGVMRLVSLAEHYGVAEFSSWLTALNDYGERLAEATLAQIPEGEYTFEDFLDDDGLGNTLIRINAKVSVAGGKVAVDFAGTSPQVAGNVNCPLSVAAAAVFYVFRCLMPAQTPACAGTFRPIQLKAEPGSLVNANYPAAVAAGNVETSTRIVDVLLGALAKAIPERIPAASHGSMNNLAMGRADRLTGKRWDYYETIGGGMGASALSNGMSAVQTHMTNTLNTPIESLEAHYPLRVNQYAIRTNSGGAGDHVGGNGIVRELQFLEPAEVTLLTERRVLPPWNVGASSQPGRVGENRLNGEKLPGKVAFHAKVGDVLCIETPGGGGWSA